MDVPRFWNSELGSSDTVTDGTNQIGLTDYLYDETTGAGHAALATTSGLPQHVAAAGQRGNLTTIEQFPTVERVIYTRPPRMRIRATHSQ